MEVLQKTTFGVFVKSGLAFLASLTSIRVFAIMNLINRNLFNYLI